MRRPAALLCAAAVAVAVLGCGSAEPGELPPAAEPRVSPTADAEPDGRVVRIGPPNTELSADRTASPGGAPEGLAVTEGVLAVALRRPPELALVELGTGRVRRRIPVPGAAFGPRHLDARAGLFAVPAEGGNRLLIVRARDGRVIADEPTGAQPHDVSWVQGGLIVGDERSSGLTRIEDGQVVGETKVALQPGGVAAAGGGRSVAVVSVRERVLELYDARTLELEGRVDGGLGPTHVVAQDDLAWVADTEGNALLVFSLEPEPELIRRIRLVSGPYGLALDERRRQLWITLTGKNRVIGLTAERKPEFVDAFVTVPQPNDVAVDPASGRLAIGGWRDGLLQLIDP